MRVEIAANRRRGLATVGIALAALSLCGSLAGAAETGRAGSEEARAAAFRWDDRSFWRAGALRRHVEARGVHWERFLSSHPSVIRAFRLEPVRWGGRSFYAARSLRGWLDSRNGSFVRWSRIHRKAAVRLARNDRAARMLNSSQRDGRGEEPSSPTSEGAPRDSQPGQSAAGTSSGSGAAGSSAGSRAGRTTAGFGVSPDNIEYLDAGTRNRVLDELVEVGARWIRFDVKWAAIQWESPETWSWQRYDDLIEAARARGLKILATLAYTPPWARPSSCTGAVQCAPRDMEAFGRWAQVVVERYRGRISHWEIWNESNSAFWLPKPDPRAYVQMLKATYPRIKSVAPEATVIAGATAPAPSDGWAIDEVEFLQQVYAHGARGLFDAWSHHPYSHPREPSFDHPHNAWQQMSRTSPSVRSVLAANGDGDKQVWATEFGSPSSGGPNAVSEEVQARHLTEAFGLWRSYDWAGVLFWYSANDLSAYGASGEAVRFHGFLRHDFSHKPAWDAFRRAAG